MNTPAQEVEGLSVSAVARSILERAEARFGGTTRAERLRALLKEVVTLADGQTESMQRVRSGSALPYIVPLLVTAALVLLAARLSVFRDSVYIGPTHVAELLQGVDAGVALGFFLAAILAGAHRLPKLWLRRKFRSELRKLRRLAEDLLSAARQGSGTAYSRGKSAKRPFSAS